MKAHDIALTCRSAFEAFENSQCRSLQTELDASLLKATEQEKVIAMLKDEICFLHGTCGILYSTL
jgi:hypothetical protein